VTEDLYRRPTHLTLHIASSSIQDISHVLDGYSMATLMVGMQNSLLVLQSSNEYKIHERLKGTDPHIIAFDPRNPSRAYCGTFGDGLWKTDDNGHTWNRIGKDAITSPYVTSVSVWISLVARENKFNKVYVGTEPSSL
jgi:hypothetical protein